jgi:hypothetical protein
MAHSRWNCSIRSTAGSNFPGVESCKAGRNSGFGLRMIVCQPIGKVPPLDTLLIYLDSSYQSRLELAKLRLM